MHEVPQITNVYPAMLPRPTGWVNYSRKLKQVVLQKVLRGIAEGPKHYKSTMRESVLGVRSNSLGL